ncbi:hypothetical protein [Ruminococcus sp.]|uniref:hypothetical protein n=1 Tax=Ruminococcus sp. TaxID=41978 RepID=UPI000EE06B38|nr:hypothetical protein [Ruminococcus sp.]MCI6616523.1 hypothetical protein [Ruminococcus sp.]HCI60435.1 hypothetical protein [Ruminococcus sp.]
MSSEKIDIQNTAIEVSTEQLSAKAAQIKNICSDIFTHFNNIEKCVESLPYYWSSESARLLKKYFDEDKKESQSLKERFENQVGRLIQIAGVYNDSEKNIASDIETLPNNIID